MVCESHSLKILFQICLSNNLWIFWSSACWMVWFRKLLLGFSFFVLGLMLVLVCLFNIFLWLLYSWWWIVLESAPCLRGKCLISRYGELSIKRKDICTSMMDVKVFFVDVIYVRVCLFSEPLTKSNQVFLVPGNWCIKCTRLRNNFFFYNFHSALYKVLAACCIVRPCRRNWSLKRNGRENLRV